MNRDRYTLEFKIQVAKDHCGGMSINRVAEKYKIAKSSVYKWTRLYSCGRLIEPEDPYTKEQKDTAVMKYVWGTPKKEIAEESGVPLLLLNDWIDEYFYRVEQERQKLEQEKRVSIFRERQHSSSNGKDLRTVYPTSASAYVTWAK
jgi:transposase-like protein